MSQQLIGVGTVANDGTGDPLRTAFQKVNANDTELYHRFNTSTSDPGVSDDNTAGWVVGAIWMNSNTGRVFQARSVATGAAKWQPLQQSIWQGYIANNWYLPAPYSFTATSGSPSVNSIRAMPGVIIERCTLSNLGGRVIANVAGNVQYAIYANNPATNRPTGTALVSTASMSTGTAGTISSAASIQLEPGMYWFCGNTDTAAVSYTTYISTTNSPMGSMLGSTTAVGVLGGSSGSITAVTTPQTFGTWPDLTSATFTELIAGNTVHGVAFQVASVP